MLDDSVIRVVVGICTALQVLLLLICLLCVHQSRSYSLQYAHEINDIIGSNWGTDMIYAVTNNPNYPLSKGQYLDAFKFKFPGNDDMCECSFFKVHSDAPLHKIEYGTKNRRCNSTELDNGCNELTKADTRYLTKWREGQVIYIVRQSNTSFNRMYDKMKEDGSCEEGYMRCGDSQSPSKGICIDADIGECPLTDISSTPKLGYSKYRFKGFDLYTERNNFRNPLTDALISEDHLCFIRSQYSRTPDREDYNHIDIKYEECEEDKSAKVLGDIGEADFFDLNGVQYKGLLEEGVSNTFRYKLFTGTYVEWSPSSSCRSLKAEHEQHKNIDQDMGGLTWLFWFSLVYLIFILGDAVLILEIIRTKAYCDIKIYWLYAIRLALLSFVVYTLWMSNSIIHKNEQYISQLETQNCSTVESNKSMTAMISRYEHYVINRYYWSYWCYIFLFIIRIAAILIEAYMSNRT